MARLSSAKAPTAVRICSVPPKRPDLRLGLFFIKMLTPQDEDFIRYWEEQRQHKKKFLNKLSIGLPLGVLLAVAVLVNFLSGWYKRADAELHTHSSVIIVVLIALTGIVIFITRFSAQWKWEQNELHYQELLAKKKKALQQSENK